MVLEWIANPSSGESRFKSSSLFRSANFIPREPPGVAADC
jgi:hypothetical protein